MLNTQKLQQPGDQSTASNKEDLSTLRENNLVTNPSVQVKFGSAEEVQSIIEENDYFTISGMKSKQHEPVQWGTQGSAMHNSDKAASSSFRSIDKQKRDEPPIESPSLQRKGTDSFKRDGAPSNNKSSMPSYSKPISRESFNRVGKVRLSSRDKSLENSAIKTSRSQEKVKESDDYLINEPEQAKKAEASV